MSHFGQGGHSYFLHRVSKDLATTLNFMSNNTSFMTEMKQKIQIRWLIPPSYGIRRHFTADTYLQDVLKIDDNWKSTELAIKFKKMSS